MPVGVATLSDHYAAIGPRLGGASLRDALRSCTRASHQSLDAQVSRLDLQLLADYRTFLRATAAALLPLEAALVRASVGEAFPDWQLRARSRCIQEDLIAVGVPQPEIVSIGPFGFEDILGTMYVLEGSRLGSRVLMPIVTKSIDRRVASATRYLSHGTTSGLWQSFLLRLEHSARCTEFDAVARAALRAFALFENSFSAPVVDS